MVERERRMAKAEETFEQVLGTLSWFVTAEPVRDDWAPQMRLLRGQATVAQAAREPDLQEFAEWFASEVERGLKQARFCFIQFDAAQDRLSHDDVDRAVEQIMHPFRSWVKNTMDLVVIWLRGSASMGEIRLMADGAARLKWDAERIEDEAARRGGTQS